MTEQPEQPKVQGYCRVCGEYHSVSEPHAASYYQIKRDPLKPPPNSNPFAWPPKPESVKQEFGPVSDALLELLTGTPRAGERPPVELPADRRAHVVQRAAEFKEWVANGMTRQEALALVAMEIQLEHRDKKRREEGL